MLTDKYVSNVRFDYIFLCGQFQKHRSHKFNLFAKIEVFARQQQHTT